MLMQEQKFGQSKMGRRRLPYQSPTSGKTYDGLYKRPGDNRWTIIETNETFRQNDEQLAIDEFYRRTGKNKKGRIAFTAGGEQISEQSADVIEQAIEGAAAIALEPHHDLAAIYRGNKALFTPSCGHCFTPTPLSAQRVREFQRWQTSEICPCRERALNCKPCSTVTSNTPTLPTVARKLLKQLGSDFTETTGASNATGLDDRKCVKIQGRNCSRWL